MKTIVNKTRAPIKVPLPRGKSLHLGPSKSGQIADGAEEHAPLKKLVEAGKIEIFEGGESRKAAMGESSAPHEATHGQGPSSFRQRRGDRGS